jgi:hypothetical protein
MSHSVYFIAYRKLAMKYHPVGGCRRCCDAGWEALLSPLLPFSLTRLSPSLSYFLQDKTDGSTEEKV